VAQAPDTFGPGAPWWAFFLITRGDGRRGGLCTEECTMRILAVMLLMAITLGGPVSAGKKPATNKEKILGPWKLTSLFNTSVFTFTTDGKFTMERDHVLDLARGNYEMNGDTLKITATFARDGAGLDQGDSLSWKIKSISDKDLVVEIKNKAKTESFQLARVPLPAGAKEIADSDRKKLQGTWEHVGTETDGKLVKDKDSGGTTVFKGDKFVLQSAGEKREGTFLLNANRKLKAIQLNFNDVGNFSTFAYELDGDTLRICQGPNGSFPTEFKTKGTNNRFEEFKRVKK
jgi:uncharacterized protein (TIGR03067 family)